MISGATVWITCQGRRGQCNKKLARLLPDGRFEIKVTDVFIYVCSGVTLMVCPVCGTKCLLICSCGEAT